MDNPKHRLTQNVNSVHPLPNSTRKKNSRKVLEPPSLQFASKAYKVFIAVMWGVSRAPVTKLGQILSPVAKNLNST